MPKVGKVSSRSAALYSSRTFRTYTPTPRHMWMDYIWRSCPNLYNRVSTWKKGVCGAWTALRERSSLMHWICVPRYSMGGRKLRKRKGQISKTISSDTRSCQQLTLVEKMAGIFSNTKLIFNIRTKLSITDCLAI